MAEIKITKQNFEHEVLKADLPVLLDLWAGWCGPCRMLAPILSDLAVKYDGRIKIGKINVDEEPELAEVFQAASIPMLLMIEGGKVVKASVGYRPYEQLEAFILPEL